MEYVSAQNISVKWGISKRRVQYLCMNNRIPGATRIGNMWVIPSDANKPKDNRYRERTFYIDSLSTQTRKSRRKIKSIVDSTFADLSSKGLSPTDILNTLIITFSSSILQTYIDDSNLCMNICENFFDYTITSMI